MPTLTIEPTGAINNPPAVAINSSTWTEVGRLTLHGKRRAAMLYMTVGAGGALTHLKITRGLFTESGSPRELDWLVDTDLNTATLELLDCLPANAYQQAAGGVIQVKLDRLHGVPEIAVYAKGDATTLTVEGQIH